MGVDRPESLVKGKPIKYRYAAMYEVEVSPSVSDTVTLEDYDSTVALDQAWMVQKSNGSEVTCTKAVGSPYNKVTVSGSGTNLDCVLFVMGVKA